DEAADIDTIVVPIGGGGLITGIAVAAKAIDANSRIVGVEAERSCPFQTSVRAGHLVEIVPGPTLADGLAGNPEPEAITFAPILRLVDEMETVTEDQIVRAIAGLVRAEHLIAEGAGAVSIAAAMSGQLGLRQHAAVILSGGNIDVQRLAELLR